MPEATLTLSIPRVTWVGHLTREYPEARVRILAAIAADEGGVGLAELAASDLDGVLATVLGHPSVVDLDLLERGDGEALVQFRTSEPLLLVAARGSGLPLELPFEVQDGEATWSVVASSDTLSALGDQLDLVGIDYTVESVSQAVEVPEGVLTERQRWLVETAIERGYYDTPRRISLTELADEVGLAKSSASETLHRAEERLIKRFVEDGGDRSDTGLDAAGAGADSSA